MDAFLLFTDDRISRKMCSTKLSKNTLMIVNVVGAETI